jgi:ATP-dependent Clp protease ATP-binding subunit ClpA
MFASLKRKLGDSRLLTCLFTAAESLARAQGRAKPGSEHFVLAALDLPDGRARTAFAALGLSRDAFLSALAGQREAALAAVGVVLAPGARPADAALLPAPAALYEADASGQALARRLAQAERGGRALSSADVLLAVAEEEHTPAARALRALGTERAALRQAATAAA